MSFLDLLEFGLAFLILLLIWLVLSGLYFDRKLGVASVPLMPSVRRKIMKLTLSHCPPCETISIAELGCGWGGMLRKLAKAYPDARITGYELAPWPIFISRLRCFFYKDRLKIIKADFFEADLKDYDLIFCYLSPSHMKKLAEKLKRAKKGQILISASFELPGYQQVEKARVKRFIEIPIYVYKLS